VIQDVLAIFVQVILEFIIELGAFIVVVFYFFNKKERFIGRFFLALLFVLIIGFGLSFFYYYFGDTLWGRVLVYLTLFAAFIPATKFVVNEQFVPVIFYLGVAYAIQNIVYKVWLILFVFMVNNDWDLSWGDNYNLIYHIIYYSFLVIMIVITALVFRFFFHKSLSDRVFSKRILLVTMFCLLTTVVLCSFEDIAFKNMSTGREHHFDNGTLLLLRQSGNLLSILSCVLVLYLSSKAIKENHLTNEVEYLEHTIKQSKQQYEISKDTIDMINIKCHDIKYQIRSLASTGNFNQEELKKLEESVNIYDSKLDTGNQMLNVLLWEKSSFCKQNNINFGCMVDGTIFEFMDSGDLYCLFGNIIDNALEAVKNIKDEKQRIINISTRKRGNMIFIDQDNYYHQKLEFNNDLPETTKEDKNFHGFGLRSIKIIARKYGGEMSISTSNNVFHLSIILTDNTTK